MGPMDKTDVVRLTVKKTQALHARNPTKSHVVTNALVEKRIVHIEDFRQMDCSEYEPCLREACAKDWPDFVCTNCPNFKG